QQSLAAGTTLLGDISTGGESWKAINDSPLKARVFYELLGLTAERADAAISAVKDWIANHQEHPHSRTRPGLSPHAPYSFRFDRLPEVVQFDLPIAIHIAESIDELDLISDHDGEFVSFLEELGAWDATGLPILDGSTHPLQV